MAPGDKQPDGTGLFSLSSIYGDEDDEMDDVNDDKYEEKERPEIDAMDSEDGEDVNKLEDDANNSVDRIVASDSAEDNTGTPKLLNLENSVPPPQLPQQPVPSESNKSRVGKLTIVDYDHDEVAMSPEAEEGEITGRVMFGAELQATTSGNLQEKTPPGAMQIVTPSLQGTPQSSEELEPLQLDAVIHVNESDSLEVEDVNVSVEVPEDADPLERFLPPPPKSKCSEDLQERIRKFLALKRRGKSFNSEVRNRKEYRNPDFLLHAVMYQDIDQIGSCFSKDVFDPHGYDKSDYYDEIEIDMKRDMERKEQERKKSPKLEFRSGGTQPGIVPSAPKVNMQIPGVPTAVSGGLHVGPTAVDAVGLDVRQNKKSKWDKVDGDHRNPLSTGGQDSVSAVGAHAALLSAANAGSGYTVYAQQKRREAEDRRTSEKRLERRS